MLLMQVLKLISDEPQWGWELSNRYGAQESNKHEYGDNISFVQQGIAKP